MGASDIGLDCRLSSVRTIPSGAQDDQIVGVVGRACINGIILCCHGIAESRGGGKRSVGNENTGGRSTIDLLIKIPSPWNHGQSVMQSGLGHLQALIGEFDIGGRFKVKTRKKKVGRDIHQDDSHCEKDCKKGKALRSFEDF